MADSPAYDVAVVGGGPAGLTTAIYTTRLGHRTVVFEKPGGRHATVAHVHNFYGVSEDVSGSQLAKHAVDQFESYGGTYRLEPVEDVWHTDGLAEGQTDADAASDDGTHFAVESGSRTVATRRVVFATGFRDVPPSVPDLRRFAGRGLHYCLHCDAYSLGDGPVYVLGHDDHAAHVAMVLLNVTDDVDLLLDGEEPAWSESTARQVDAHPVEVVETPVTGAYEQASGAGTVDGAGHEDRAEPDDGVDRDDAVDPGDADEPWLGGLTFADGTDRDYLGGFAMYGREYATALAEGLGCDLAEGGAIDVDGDHETSVEGAYAVGDVTHGQNQTAIALGDGARAGVAIHKDLRSFPIPAADLGADAEIDPDDVPAAPGDLRARMVRDRARDTHPGLREPDPDR